MDQLLHELLDFGYGENGDRILRERLEGGADVDARHGPAAETPLHVAARRRRVSACTLLLDHGAGIDLETHGGKTAYAHAVRRRFGDLEELLVARGASTDLAPADRFAVAVVNGRLDDARTIRAAHPGVARTGNPEEDRLLADVAGRHAAAPVVFLIEAGADLAAPGLDGGTPLHQAAWFGQPDNARLLIEAGAPLDDFDPIHGSSPIGWVAHGSRYSGDADRRSSAYVALARLLLDAGASLCYPDQPSSDAYVERLIADASSAVRAVLAAR